MMFDSRIKYYSEIKEFKMSLICQNTTPKHLCNSVIDKHFIYVCNIILKSCGYHEIFRRSFNFSFGMECFLCKKMYSCLKKS